MIKHTFIILLTLFLTSCVDRREKNKDYLKYKDIKITEDVPKTVHNDIKYELILPDTIKKGTSYDAIFNFKSEFDNITDPMKDSLRYRIITFYYFEPLKSPIKKEGVDLHIKDSIFIPNKKFILGNVKFKESGEHIFAALIKDEIMYSYYTGKHRDSVHFSRKMQQVFKKVVVID